MKATTSKSSISAASGNNACLLFRIDANDLRIMYKALLQGCVVQYRFAARYVALFRQQAGRMPTNKVQETY